MKKKIFLGALSLAGVVPLSVVAMSATGAKEKKDKFLIEGLEGVAEDARTSFDSKLKEVEPVFAKFKEDYGVSLNDEFINFQKERFAYYQEDFKKTVAEYNEQPDEVSKPLDRMILTGLTMKLTNALKSMVSIYVLFEKELDKANALNSVISKYKVKPVEEGTTLTEEQIKERKINQDIYNKLIESLKKIETAEKAKTEENKEKLQAYKNEHSDWSEEEMNDFIWEVTFQPGAETYISAYLENLSVDFSAKWGETNDKLEEKSKEYEKAATELKAANEKVKELDKANEVLSENSKEIADLKALIEKYKAADLKQANFGDLVDKMNEIFEITKAGEVIFDKESLNEYHSKIQDILSKLRAKATELRAEIEVLSTEKQRLENENLKLQKNESYANSDTTKYKAGLIASTIIGLLLLLLLVLLLIKKYKKEEEK
ncbi:coiled-coil domain-containing protein [Mycoplasmopsis glycophila]|uniref:Uncharacterized protein n=1 Tax=Mycoplasmopsis glycophila TaxID=171285 RepID=A0A449AU58_9BACT|nr:hypothetical protein [Mycoplasmopsis glycophila]VEU70059.1 Uncharacterised protein [Mycoplasmopsis glycophila]